MPASRKLLPLGALLLCCVAVAQAQRPQTQRLQRPNRPERTPDRLEVGDAAPDFTLNLMHGKSDETVTLSDFQGERPVALVFGSYT